jgi:hypothetical protein
VDLAPLPETKWSGVAVGGSHACARDPRGTSIYCWGLNTFGQSSPPDRDGNPSSGLYLYLAAGDMHSCVMQGHPMISIHEGADVKCWGYDLDGRSTPPEGLKAIGICSGETFSCGLSPVPGYKSPRMQGTPVCWGGDQYRIVSSTPTEVPMVGITCGLHHACGVLADGAAMCWGRNHREQADPPTDLSFLHISAGTFHSCGIQHNGTATCWGDVESPVPPGEVGTLFLPAFGRYDRPV